MSIVCIIHEIIWILRKVLYGTSSLKVYVVFRIFYVLKNFCALNLYYVSEKSLSTTLGRSLIPNMTTATFSNWQLREICTLSWFWQLVQKAAILLSYKYPAPSPFLNSFICNRYIQLSYLITGFPISKIN